MKKTPMRKIDLALENSIFSHDLCLSGEVRLAALVAACRARFFVVKSSPLLVLAADQIPFERS
jgi:hypothetical protein